MSIATVRKAAVLLMSLPDDEAGPLLAQLNSSELAALANEIARQLPATPSEQAAVLRELANTREPSLSASSALLFPADNPVRSAMSRRETSTATRRSQERFSYLRNVDSQTVTQALRDEHLQTVALVLNHLPTAQRDRILRGLPAAHAASVVRRLDALGQVRCEVVDDVERGLEQNLALALGKWLPEAA